MSEGPRKRSRFDDHRSRSPSKVRDSPVRERSTIAAKVESPATEQKEINPKAKNAAALVLERIQNDLKNKGITGGSSAVPIARQTSSTPVTPGPAKSPSLGANGTTGTDIYQQDGDYITDIEVNDLRNRYTLTKGSTQKEIKEKTGADVTTRGEFYPDKSMATAAKPPLYLHVTSQTKESLEAAVAEIKELMAQELPDLIDQRRIRRRPEVPQIERDERGRRKWPETQIPIDLEPIPGFNLRAQVVGQGGAFVKHIQNMTTCKVQIKGQGSGYKEFETQLESDEPMYLHVSGRDDACVADAKEQCLSLLETVKKNYQEHKARASQQRGSYADRRNGGDGRHHAGYGHSSGGGGHGSGWGYGSYAVSDNVATTPNTQDWTQSQQQQMPSAEILAAYGGWDGYRAAAWQAYYAQQAAGAGAPAFPDSAAAPPPPPDSSDAPPPPPDSSVPPPPPPGV